MVEKIKPYWEKLKNALKKISKKVWIALAVLVLVAVAAVLWLNSSRTDVVLYTDLNATEMSEILTYLDGAGITEYTVRENDTILVPEGQESALRARLLMEGYPESGFGYTYSASTGALSTESERNQAFKQDLQDRMSATIRCFDDVKDAVVNINTGEDSSFVLDSSRAVKATAAVFVTMQDGKKLTNDQVSAIRRLVSHSVKNLDVSSVTVEDGAGNRYGDSGDSPVDSEATALKIQTENQYEDKIRDRVLEALIPLFGEDNVTVGVNCTVDISQTVVESTDYFLPEFAEDGSTYGRGIVGSRVFSFTTERNGGEPVGGLVGTETNADVSEYVEDLPELTGDETLVDISGQVDYKTSETNKQIIQTAGYLTDCSIAVTINASTAGAVNLDQIEQHVARASGITGAYDEVGTEYLEDKISVMIAPFYEPPTEPPAEIPVAPGVTVEPWILYIAAGVLLLLAIILFIILKIRKRKKKKKQEAEKARDMAAFLAAAEAATKKTPENGADVMSIQSEKSIELRKDIRKVAEENPEIAAQMLKSWVRGGDDNG